MVKECQEKSGNSTNARNYQGNIKKNVLSLSINKYPIMLKELARRYIMPIVKLLVFIFHDGNRTHFTRTSKSLRK